ncbi:MAG: TlpA disulfide reductase family protein [Fimbriimonadales bacterium]
MKRLLVGAVIGIWIGLVVTTFWRMEWRFLQPAERPSGASRIDPTQKPYAPVFHLQSDRGRHALKGQLTLLNFWSPDCACSRFMERHVRELVSTYAPRGVQFITVIVGERNDETPQRLLDSWYRRRIDTPAVADVGGALSRQFGVWAGPSAVIVNPEGRIVYIGAYNIGRYCDNRKTAYAQQALEALLSGREPERASTPFYGCQVPSAE